jgi:acyl carrier protein
LAALPGVKEAAVMAREDTSGSKQLVAYFLQDEAIETGAEQLRGQLQTQLPDYMVPTAFVKMAAWPLTRNGKLDRKALPISDAATMQSSRPYVAPRTPIEEVLAVIWIELLGVDRVGIHDNFFDLGGHSLMAMRLIAAVRDTLGITLPLKTFFESPTIEHMGRSLLPDEVEDEGEGNPLETMLH